MVDAWIWRSGQRGGFDDLAFEQNVVVLGLHMIADLTDHTDRDSIRSLVVQAVPAHWPGSRIQTMAAQLYAFRSAIAVGDLVLMLSHRVTKVAIGRVTGAYEYRAKDRLHVRSVTWLRTGVDRVAVGEDLLRAPAGTALYRIQATDAATRLLSVAEQGADSVRRRQRTVPAQRPAANGSGPAWASADLDGVHEPASGAPRPLERLLQNLDHARSLARAGEALQSAGNEEVDVADVYRAAWVQGCTALDHWVRQEVTQRAFALARSESPPERVIEGLSASLVEAMQVARGEKRPDDLLRRAISRYHERRAYLQPEPIRRAFSLVADTDDLWERVAGYLADDGLDSDYDAMSVPEAMTTIAARRNLIAHQYDEDRTSPDGKRPLTDAQVLDMLEWLERLANAITAALPDDGAATPAARAGEE